jgi:hypothetical protein
VAHSFNEDGLPIVGTDVSSERSCPDGSGVREIFAVAKRWEQ